VVQLTEHVQLLIVSTHVHFCHLGSLRVFLCQQGLKSAPHTFYELFECDIVF
jgi:hypothetical protein